MAPVFKPMITRQIAHSAFLLARLWDEIYEKAGKPPLQYYGAYKFPVTPDFVAPDYLVDDKVEATRTGPTQGPTAAPSPIK
jgi:hypothetical protein